MLNKLKKIEIEVDVEYKKYKQAWKAVSHKLEEIYSKIKQSENTSRRLSLFPRWLTSS